MQHSSYTQLQLKLTFWKDALASLPHLDIIQHSMGLEYNRNIISELLLSDLHVSLHTFVFYDNLEILINLYFQLSKNTEIYTYVV